MKRVDWKRRMLEGWRAQERSIAFAIQLRRGFEKSLRARAR